MSARKLPASGDALRDLFGPEAKRLADLRSLPFVVDRVAHSRRRQAPRVLAQCGHRGRDRGRAAGRCVGSAPAGVSQSPSRRLTAAAQHRGGTSYTFTGLTANDFFFPIVTAINANGRGPANAANVGTASS